MANRLRAAAMPLAAAEAEYAAPRHPLFRVCRANGVELRTARY